MHLEDTTQKLTQELTLIRVEYDHLFTKFKRSQELFEERDVLMKRHVDSLIEQNQYLNKHLMELKTGIKTQYIHNLSFDADVENLEKLARSQEEQIVKQEEQIANLEAKVSTLTLENTRYLRDLNIKADDIDNLRAELGRVKLKMSNDYVTKSEYDIEIDKFQHFKKHVDENMITLVLYQQIQGKYELLQSEKIFLEKSLVAQRESNAVLSDRLKDASLVSSELAACKLREADLSHALVEKDLLIEASMVESKELRESIAKVEQSNNGLTIQIGLLKQQSRRDTDEVKKIRNEMTASTKNQEHESVKYQLEISRLSSSNNELMSRSTSVEAHLLDTIKKLEMENRSLVDLNTHYKNSASHWVDKARYFEMQLVSIQQVVLSPDRLFGGEGGEGIDFDINQGRSKQYSPGGLYSFSKSNGVERSSGNDINNGSSNRSSNSIGSININTSNNDDNNSIRSPHKASSDIDTNPSSKHSNNQISLDDS